MVPPLVAGLAGIYAVGKSFDTLRFYYEYHKNTGFYPRYVFRSFGTSPFSNFNWK